MIKRHTVDPIQGGVGGGNAVTRIAAAHPILSGHGGDDSVRVNFANATIIGIGEIDIAQGIAGHLVGAVHGGIGGRTAIT